MLIFLASILCIGIPMLTVYGIKCTPKADKFYCKGLLSGIKISAMTAALIPKLYDILREVKCERRQRVPAPVTPPQTDLENT